ncbi:MAG: hypothetical protein WCG21_11235 [Eubacteriales bacterium]
MIYLLAVLHALVDAACAAKLYSYAGSLSVQQLSSWFFLYNLLAFSTQAFTGGFLDVISQRQNRLSAKFTSDKHARSNLYLVFAVSGALIVALGAAISFSLPAAICLIGMGNSFFHVGGGGYSLSVSKGKAAGIGIFVGPGSLGLTAGILFPDMKLVYVIGLVLACIAVVLPGVMRDSRYIKKSLGAMPELMNEKTVHNNAADQSIREVPSLPPWILVLTAILLCLAVAFRAFGGSFPGYSWKKGIPAILIAAIIVMGGKIAGGFAYDQFGAWKTIVISSIAAAPVIVLFSGNAPASLIGIFALNIAMPVTLVLLYRCLHQYPAFTFGMAASVLFPGSLLGQMAGTALKKDPAWEGYVIYICCSIAALLFVLISYRLITRENIKKEDFSCLQLLS